MKRDPRALAATAPAYPALPTDFGIPYGVNARLGFWRYMEPRHLLTFGPTGSGKGATVIIPALLLVPHSVVCIDPKGQNAWVTRRRRREMGQDVFLLNPFNELGLGTARINPLARLRIDQPNVMADVRSLADALIVPVGGDSHWTDSALDLITALLLYLVATKPGTATLLDMRRLLTDPEAMFLKTVEKMVALRDYPFISEFAARFGKVSKEIASVISTAQTQTSFLSDKNIAHVLSGDEFSMAQLKEKPTTVYVILPVRYIDAFSRFFRLVITTAIDQLTEKPGGRKTLLILDEFATMKNLSAVSRAFGFARGYNVQVWPFLQDLPQLKSLYGENLWESFMANAGVVQMFTPSDMTTADYLMRRAGNKEVEQTSLSISDVTQEQRNQGLSGISESRAKQMRPLMPPELSMSMSKHGQILFFSGTHSPRQEWRLSYYHNPRLAGLWDADPFHT